FSASSAKAGPLPGVFSIMSFSPVKEMRSGPQLGSGRLAPRARERARPLHTACRQSRGRPEAAPRLRRALARPPEFAVPAQFSRVRSVRYVRSRSVRVLAQVQKIQGNEAVCTPVRGVESDTAALGVQVVAGSNPVAPTKSR